MCISPPQPNLRDGRSAARTAPETEIAKRAYEKYEARGRVDGFDLDDWFAASRELAAEAFGHVGLPSHSQTHRLP